MPTTGDDRAIRLPLDAQQRAVWQARLNTLAVLTHLGAELDLSDDDAVRIRLVRALPAHSGGLGGDAVNGATLAALVDCAVATTGVLLFRGRTCGTLQLSIDFMKPVRTALPEIECRVLRRTSTLGFVEARLPGPRGALHLKASGIVSVAKASAGDGESWKSRFAAEPRTPAALPHFDPVARHDPATQAA
jgi:acyl-coenzyme A thioesterase PaaI-like protein